MGNDYVAIKNNFIVWFIPIPFSGGFLRQMVFYNSDNLRDYFLCQVMKLIFILISAHSNDYINNPFS